MPDNDPRESESQEPEQSEPTGWSVTRGGTGEPSTSQTLKRRDTRPTGAPRKRRKPRKAREQSTRKAARDLSARASAILRRLPDTAQTVGRTIGGPDTTLSRRELLENLALFAVSGAAAAAVAATSSVFPPTSQRRPGLGGGLSGKPFPLGASTRARTEPVEIDFWHSMSAVNLTALSTLTNQFNSAQGDVRVNLVAKASYLDTVNSYLAALRKGTVPDLVQVQTPDLQLIVDTHSIVPIESAVDADHYGLSDYLPSTLECFKLEEVLWALPFNAACQVLYYDKNAFAAAGLDPGAPPASLADITITAQKIVSTKTERYGMSLKVTDALFEDLLALAGSDLADNANGRDARATSVTFDEAQGKAIFAWWSDMLASQLAQPTPFSTFDNLVAVANRVAPMTFESSAGLSTVVSVLEEFPGVSIGVAPLPSPTSVRGGRLASGAGLCICSRSHPDRQDAAWSYVKYLNDPAQQATWAAATGFVPVRKSAVGLPQLAQVWNAYPGYAVAYEQLAINPANPVTAGAAVGPFAQIESAINDALGSLSTGTRPDKALSNAARACDQAIASYNSRL